MAEEELNEEPAPPSALELRPRPQGLEALASDHWIKWVAIPKWMVKKNTPENERIRPLKRDELSVGNTSEPTIDFQGKFVSFPGSTMEKPLLIHGMIFGGKSHYFWKHPCMAMYGKF